jgi:hypothetical protein
MTVGAASLFGQEVSEYQVKAAYVYNFARFVQWPERAFSDSSAPLELCVFSRSPILPDLQLTIRGKAINGRTIRVTPVENAEQGGACHVLFFSYHESGQFRDVLARLQDTSVLTVGEGKDFVRQGGMINFVVVDDRVQFDVNQTAAERAGISISSRLLTVARSVIR